MDQAWAKKTLLEAKKILDEHQIEYWLNFGGLLGAVREGKVISYDDDVELNAWRHKVSNQQIRNISRDLSQAGFNVYYSTLTDYISIRKNKIPIAFSLYTLEGDRAVRPNEPVLEHGLKATPALWFYYISEIFAAERIGKINREVVRDVRRFVKFCFVSISYLFSPRIRRKISIFFRTVSMKIKKGYGKTSIPARFYLELKDFVFYGETFKVPQATEEYLKFVYGPSWKIPMKDWNFHDEENKSVTGIQFLDERWNYAERL